MKIVIAPDKFKGSLSAMEVCRAVAAGIYSVNPLAQVVLLPMADGGEGTARILTDLKRGKIRKAKVNGPAGQPIDSWFGLSENGNDAFIEMASASGLQLLSLHERNPAYTTTVGTGELILAALDAGARKIILGIGGSATHDGGTGMASALGVKFLDKKGNAFVPVGYNLHQIDRISLEEIDPRVAQTEFIVLCDVDNPLLGENGAAVVFAPQKGADADTVLHLENGMFQLAQLIKKDFHMNIDFPGAGAAGGMGAGAMLFLGASIERGIDFIMRYSNLENILQGADLVISGEGKADRQTLQGKVVSGVADLCAKLNVDFWLVAGKVELNEEELKQLGVKHIISLMKPDLSEGESLLNAAALLQAEVHKAFSFCKKS